MKLKLALFAKCREEYELYDKMPSSIETCIRKEVHQERSFALYELIVAQGLEAQYLDWRNFN